MQEKRRILNLDNNPQRKTKLLKFVGKNEDDKLEDSDITKACDQVLDIVIQTMDISWKNLWHYVNKLKDQANYKIIIVEGSDLLSVNTAKSTLKNITQNLEGLSFSDAMLNGWKKNLGENYFSAVDPLLKEKRDTNAWTGPARNSTGFGKRASGVSVDYDLENMPQKFKDEVLMLNKDFYLPLKEYMMQNAKAKPTQSSTISLGKQEVFPVGLGCLHLSINPKLSEDDAIKLLQHAYKQGVTYFDTAAVYGDDRANEKLLGKAFSQEQKEKVILSTKCGISFSPEKPFSLTEKEIRESVTESLQNLQVKKLDMLYLHRLPTNASKEDIESAVGVLKKLVQEGNVKHIGLSEVTAEQIRIAQNTEPKEIPITAVQSAYSLVTRRAEANGVLATCRELGIGFVAYTSVCRGFTDKKLLENISDDDIQKLTHKELQTKVFKVLGIGEFDQSVGYFAEKYIKENVKNMLAFQRKAIDLECEPSQLMLAWCQRQNIVPIPGTTQKGHLDSNINSSKIKLTDADWKELDRMFPYGSFKGNPNPALLDFLDNPNLENAGKQQAPTATSEENTIGNNSVVALSI